MTYAVRTPPQPSNIDLALCITVIRSQPPSFTTVEYIQLLRSLTVPGTHGQGGDASTYRQVMNVNDTICGQKWRKVRLDQYMTHALVLTSSRLYRTAI